MRGQDTPRAPSAVETGRFKSRVPAAAPARRACPAVKAACVCGDRTGFQVGQGLGRHHIPHSLGSVRRATKGACAPGVEPAQGLGPRTQPRGGQAPPAVRGVGLREGTHTHRAARAAARMAGTLSALWLGGKSCRTMCPPRPSNWGEGVSGGETWPLLTRPDTPRLSDLSAVLQFREKPEMEIGNGANVEILPEAFTL